MNENDVLCIEWRAVSLAQQVRMPMFYRVVGIDAPPELDFPAVMGYVTNNIVLGLFDGTGFITALSNTFSIQTVRAYNLFEVTENYEGDAREELPITGSSATDALPPFSAMSWYQGTSRRDIRSGSRRWPGLVEAHQIGGVIQSALLSIMDDVAEEMSITRSVSLPGDGVIVLQPIIVGRVKEVDEEGKVTYRLPATLEELKYYAANGWVSRANVTSQNSRKFGRGI